VHRLIARAHPRALGIGLVLMALAVLTVLQPVGESGRRASEDVAVLHARASASAATSASPSPVSAASPPSTPSPAAVVMATPAVPSPLPVRLARVPLVEATPAPATPAPAPAAPAPAAAGPSYSQADVIAILTAAAQANGVDPAWLISTARCESNLNPYSYNPSGPYDGLLQFLPSTFRAHGGTDIWDPTQQAQIAATMFANGESGQWPVCSR